MSGQHVPDLQMADHIKSEEISIDSALDLDLSPNLLAEGSTDADEQLSSGFPAAMWQVMTMDPVRPDPDAVLGVSVPRRARSQRAGSHALSPVVPDGGLPSKDVLEELGSEGTVTDAFPSDEDFDIFELDCAACLRIDFPMPEAEEIHDLECHGAQQSLESLQSVYHKPISAAAKALGIGVTVLKRQCRVHGIRRWPYRKLTSIDKLIKELLDEPDAAAVNVSLLANLQMQRQHVFIDPNIPLDDWTKKQRQNFFKKMHKIKHSKLRQPKGDPSPQT